MNDILPADTERVCFLLRLKPHRIDDYLDAHEEVWPDMRDALTAAGWRNYSLFIDRATGLIVGYLETDDFAAATAAIEATDVNSRWQATMAEYFLPSEPDSATDADSARERLDLYFHLD